MREFIPSTGIRFGYRGESYASLLEFCRRNNVDYDRLTRLRRKYMRAFRDPAVAAAWILGHEALDPANEPRSPVHAHDQRQASLRAVLYRARRAERRRAG